MTPKSKRLSPPSMLPIPSPSRCSNESSTSTAGRELRGRAPGRQGVSSPSSTRSDSRRAGSMAPRSSVPGIWSPSAGHRTTYSAHRPSRYGFRTGQPLPEFERIDDQTARGPGIIDMKGGNVVMVHALKALKAAGALDDLKVAVVMTGDEETTGEPLGAAREPSIAAAQERRHCDGVRGRSRRSEDRRDRAARHDGMEVRVKAKPAHSSQIFRKDIGTERFTRSRASSIRSAKSSAERSI